MPRINHLVQSVGGTLVAGGIAVLAGIAAFNGGPRPAADLVLAGAVAATLLLVAQNGAVLASIAIERDHRRARQGRAARQDRDDRRIRADLEHRRTTMRRRDRTTTTTTTARTRTTGPGAGRADARLDRLDGEAGDLGVR